LFSGRKREARGGGRGERERKREGKERGRGREGEEEREKVDDMRVEPYVWNNTYTYGTILTLTEQYLHLRNNT